METPWYLFLTPNPQRSHIGSNRRIKGCVQIIRVVSLNSLSARESSTEVNTEKENILLPIWERVHELPQPCEYKDLSEWAGSAPLWLYRYTQIDPHSKWCVAVGLIREHRKYSLRTPTNTCDLERPGISVWADSATQVLMGKRLHSYPQTGGLGRDSYMGNGNNKCHTHLMVVRPK